MNSTSAGSFDLMKHLPLNLSSSSAMGKKIPKQRNKKAEDTPHYDILQIDQQIHAAFEQEIANIEIYSQRISSMIKSLASRSIPFGIDSIIQSDVKKLIEESSTDITNTQLDHSSDESFGTYQGFLEFYNTLKRLILKYHNIKSGKLRETYVQMTNESLSQYRALLSVPIKTSFLTSKKARKEPENEKQKKEIIETYIKIASNFVNNGIQYISEPIKVADAKLECKCGNSTDFEIHEGITICEHCGNETHTTSAQSTFKDIDRINTHTKYRYEKSLHFNEAIAQFQGKQNKYINPNVYTRIEQWAIKHNLLDLEAMTKEEKYSKFTKDHLRLMLSESKDKTLTDHHEDVHLIYSKLTGKPCADISHLEAKLRADFDRIEQAFWASPEIDRNNILNGAFVLAKFLEKEGYPITREDFPGLKTLTRQQDHEALFAYLCQKAGIDCSGSTKRKRGRLAPP